MVVLIVGKNPSANGVKLTIRIEQSCQGSHAGCFIVFFVSQSVELARVESMWNCVKAEMSGADYSGRK